MFAAKTHNFSDQDTIYIYDILHITRIQFSRLHIKHF